jgi:malic enzyme
MFGNRNLEACRAQSIRDSQLIEAARAVASMVDDDDRRLGRVLPPLEKLPTVAKRVGIAVAKAAYDAKVAMALPKPTDLEGTIEEHVYDLNYARFA